MPAALRVRAHMYALGSHTKLAPICALHPTLHTNDVSIVQCLLQIPALYHSLQM